MEIKKERNYKIDNLKALLIFLVVFGHLINLFPGEIKKYIYGIVFIFHMPVFAYTTGYFAKFNKKRIITLIFTYLLYQTFHIFFNFYVLQEELNIQYIFPSYTLWYLIASVIWLCIIPIIQTEKINKKIIVLIVSFILAIGVGYISQIRNQLGISRTIVFMPFFILGYYRLPEKINLKDKKTIKILLLLITIIISIIFIGKLDNLKRLFQDRSYFKFKNIEIGGIMRITILSIAFLWLVVLQNILPSKNIKFISNFGKNSISIYLLHPFIVLLIKKYDLFFEQESLNLVLALIETSIICFICSSEIIYNIFSYTFSLKLFDKIKLISTGRKHEK